MAATNIDEEFNHIKGVKNRSSLKTFIDELTSVHFPSSLWRLHLDSQHKFLAFSKIVIGADLFKSSKSIVLSETKDYVLKVDIFMNNRSVHIPYISKTISNIQELNELLKAVDAVQFCRYYFRNEENQCLIFSSLFANTCRNCRYKNSNSKPEVCKWVEEQERIKHNQVNVLHDLTVSNAHQSCADEIKNCILCEKMFKTEQQLRDHEKTHIVKNVNNEFECTICLKVSVDVAATLEHYKENHTSVKFIKCSMCEHKYTNVQQLRRHIRNHNGFDAFMCDFCNKRFKSKRKLNLHDCVQRIRRDDFFKSFICSICDTKYATKHLLGQHQREHRLQVEFKCKVCKKSFDKKDEVVDHKQHCNLKRLKYICCVCDRRFSCISQKICHMKKVHHLFDNANLGANAAPSSPMN